MLHHQERPEFDEPVLLKEPAHEQLTRAQIAQLRNEHVFTRQLAHVPGVRPVYTIEGSESHPVLLLKYIQGQSLVEIIQEQSLDLLQNLQLAVEITNILSRIHEVGVTLYELLGDQLPEMSDEMAVAASSEISRSSET